MDMLFGNENSTDTAVQGEIINLSNVVSSFFPFLGELSGGIFTAFTEHNTTLQSKRQAVNKPLKYTSC